MNGYEPPLAGKVVIWGSFFAVLVIAYGAGAVMGNDAQSVAIAVSLLILIVVVTVFFSMMALLRSSLKQYGSVVPASPEGRRVRMEASPEGVEFKAKAITLDEFLTALEGFPLSDEAFQADVVRHIPQLRLKNA